MRLFARMIAAATMAVAVGFGSGARADNVLASDPQTFTDFFFEEGVPAQLSTDAYGDPFIEFRYEGKTYPLFFYDCQDNADCLAVQFYAGYEMEEPFSFERVNEWNSGEHRFARAYFTPDDNVLHLEMDIATSSDGISARDFKDLMLLWIDRVDEFEEFIGW